MSPDLVQQLLPRQQTPSISDKGMEQLQFERTNVDKVSAPPHIAASEVELYVRKCKLGGLDGAAWRRSSARSRSSCGLNGFVT
jgi:hypothetical protein